MGRRHYSPVPIVQEDLNENGMQLTELDES
jgi:hypothetical protein